MSNKQLKDWKKQTCFLTLQDLDSNWGATFQLGWRSVWVAEHLCGKHWSALTLCPFWRHWLYFLRCPQLLPGWRYCPTSWSYKNTIFRLCQLKYFISYEPKDSGTWTLPELISVVTIFHVRIKVFDNNVSFYHDVRKWSSFTELYWKFTIIINFEVSPGIFCIVKCIFYHFKTLLPFKSCKPQVVDNDCFMVIIQAKWCLQLKILKNFSKVQSFTECFF